MNDNTTKAFHCLFHTEIRQNVSGMLCIISDNHLATRQYNLILSQATRRLVHRGCIDEAPHDNLHDSQAPDSRSGQYRHAQS